MSDRNGTATCPILVESVDGPLPAVDGPLPARLHGQLDAQNDSDLHFVGLDFVTDYQVRRRLDKKEVRERIPPDQEGTMVANFGQDGPVFPRHGMPLAFRIG
jgi:hypothetical protein